MAFLVAATALTVADVGAAGTPSVTDSEVREKVGYTDMDLANGAAVRAFYERLNLAAAHVCEQYAVTKPALFRGCVSLALNSAIEKINSVPLTRYASSQKVAAISQPIQVAKAQ